MHTKSPVQVIDGDYMRKTINKDLGYTKEQRNIASERTAYVAKMLVDIEKRVKTSSHKNEKNTEVMIKKAFKNRKYFLYDPTPSSSAVFDESYPPAKEYLSFDPNESVLKTLQKNNIEYSVIKSKSINDIRVIEAFKQSKIKYCIFSGGGILRKEILNTGVKFIHIHPGKFRNSEAVTALSGVF